MTMLVTDPSRLGERLRQARTARGLTQDMAAQSMGMARTTIVAIEKGERRLKFKELQAFSDLYGVSCGYLIQNSNNDQSLHIQFRIADSATQRDLDSEAAVARLHHLSEALVEFQSVLDFSSKYVHPSIEKIDPKNVVNQAEDLALALRSRLGVGINPLGNLSQLLESELGFSIFRRPLAGRIGGVYGYSTSTGPCVLLNSVHPHTRQMFTMGHELGHFLTTRDTVDVESSDHNEQLVSERFANAFSAALLMPGAALRSACNDLKAAFGRISAQSIFHLADQFSVSKEAMCRRLESLSLIKEGTWAALESQRRFFPSNAESNTSITPERVLIEHGRVGLIAAEAYFRGHYTEAQIQERLYLDRKTVRALLIHYDCPANPLPSVSHEDH